MRYFAHISFNGINYRGWQRQVRVITIQQVIEEAMSKLLKSKITCIGCGRTDASVHARQFFFHFDFDKAWNFNLNQRLNKALPDDIAVFDIIPVEDFPHAQFDAIERTYEYYIHTSKDPFLNGFSALYEHKNLNFQEMVRAANLITSYTDYSQFCKTPERNDSNFCEVKSTKLFVNQQGDRIRFQISANRFTKGMIRVIVHRLLEVGNGSLTVKEFEDILKGLYKPKEITIAYPQGLYLIKVKYPFLDLPTCPDFFGSAINHNMYWVDVSNSND